VWVAKTGGYVPTAADGAKAARAKADKAINRAGDLAPIIAQLDPNGSMSLRALAAALNTEGLPTPAGKSTWTAVQVSRVRARLAQPAQ
jgi:hypothetical protein